MSARDDVLARIRAAVGDAPAVEVPRGYRTSLEPGVDPVALFAERVAEYRAEVHRVDDVGAAVRELLGGRRVVVPPALPGEWRPAGAVEDHGLPVGELDAADAALTGCAVAVAATGTLVLDGGELSGRRALTLVPDVHVCVVRHGQVVGTVPEALARLDPARPLTLVSGPSATSDIELERVEGVHGPRTLVVLIGP